MQNEDEEARYSAVARGHGKAGNERTFDSRNEDTFGSTTPRESGKAWSGAVNSVAAITGRFGPEQCVPVRIAHSAYYVE